MRSTALRFAIVGMALTVPTAAFAGPAPALVNQEGLLLRDGFPIDGETQNLTFRLCDLAEGGACVWTETHEDVEIRSGYYSVIMGSVEAIAGICNEARNVVGLMPHPERACESVLGSEDGRVVLESVLSIAGASGERQTVTASDRP